MSSLPPCRICGEKASGFHYGVNTCEACKAFFRRSLNKFETYICNRNVTCELPPGRRNFCALCRFKKCIDMGMCRDAIKTGRYTHEKKANDIKELKGIREWSAPPDDRVQRELQQRVQMLQDEQKIVADKRGLKRRRKGRDKVARGRPPGNRCKRMKIKEEKSNSFDSIAHSDDVALQFSEILANNNSNNNDCIYNNNINYNNNNDCSYNNNIPETIITKLEDLMDELSYIKLENVSEYLDTSFLRLDTDHLQVLEKSFTDQLIDVSTDFSLEGSPDDLTDLHLVSSLEVMDYGFPCTPPESRSADTISPCISVVSSVDSLEDSAIKHHSTHRQTLSFSSLGARSPKTPSSPASLASLSFLEFSPDFYRDQVPLIESVIQRITEVHQANTPFTKEFLKVLPEMEQDYVRQREVIVELFGPMRPMSVTEYRSIYDATGIDVDGRLELLETCLPQIEVFVKRYIGFMKYIPGFNDLTIEDQIHLIKASRLYCWAILSHRTVNPDLELMAAYDGQILGAEDLSKFRDTEFVEMFFAIHRIIKRLDLTDEESCVFSAFCLMSIDHDKLERADVAVKSQELLLKCLLYLFDKNHPEDKMRLTKFIDCFLHMHSWQEKYSQAEEQFATEWAGIVNFPPIMNELWRSS